MKKLFIMAAGALLLTACGNEDVVAPDNPTEQTTAETYEVSLNFDVNVNAGLDTRAGRELLSEEALQNVTNMTVYVFKDGVYYQLPGNKNVVVAGFNADDKNGNESHSYLFTADDRLPAGSYTFLAVGTDEGRGAFKTLTLVPGTTKREDVVMELAGTNTAAAEVFVGTEAGDPYVVDADHTTLDVKITVNRLVAGILGYFTNIPYELPNPNNTDDLKIVDKVCIETVARGLSAGLVNRDPKTKTEGGTYQKLVTMNINVANGFAKDENYNIWARASKNETAGTVRKNSAIKGAFSLPFTKVADKATMRVALYSGETLLKTYEVKCNSYEEGSETVGTHAAGKIFDIRANHLYMLGVKKKATSTDPSGNPDPDPEKEDEDKPVDLSKDDIITVTVDPRWGVTHYLGLDD